ncbi:hypothetical protein LSH36_32g09010 [Paralvinella palmiformis]|uniref:Uncharacterized protein n=1 Tax=Paralvinella palmiformis TaxID=53620 RepID=A0AAD9NE90_9ANNE|nr:hypothetical protein LSH36_32g09010 [Paralvinella palmiformis]
MEGKREISEPVGRQSPDVTSWRQSLRNSKKGLGGSLKHSGSHSNLRKSTGNLAANFGTMSGKLVSGSTDLDRIEAEYIKNLQQQVYFLELEANYLREQARKATEMHPQMSLEAERMLNKLRQMQAEVDGLHIEIKRRDASIDLLTTEKERLQGKLKVEEVLEKEVELLVMTIHGSMTFSKSAFVNIDPLDSHSREKRLLLDEIIQLKKQKDLLERDDERKDSQLLAAQDELSKSTSALKTAENKIQMLRHQLDQKTEQLRLTEQALNEKRTELLKTETQLREIEDKYYSSTTNIQDKLVQDLRDEIRLLRQKIKEAEMHADQDRYLRNKLSDDSSHLIKENALLNQQVLELQKLLDRERSLRENNDTRRSQNITELVVIKDRENNLQFELNQVKEQLQKEKERVNHYMEQLSKLEQLSTQEKLNANTTRSRLAELEVIHQRLETENSELRRDKMLLVDHVADLQNKLENTEKKIYMLEMHKNNMQTELKELENLKELESTLNTEKWAEFSRLAESMKNLSSTIARSKSPLLSRTSTSLLNC